MGEKWGNIYSYMGESEQGNVTSETMLRNRGTDKSKSVFCWRRNEDKSGASKRGAN